MNGNAINSHYFFLNNSNNVNESLTFGHGIICGVFFVIFCLAVWLLISLIQRIKNVRDK